MCEMLFTSDKEFFDKIGEKETKRYFEESYNFICSYKNLGEKNIISAVVHLDEGTAHMHLIYIPVIHTKDKERKEIMDDNKELHNEVDKIKSEYEEKASDLEWIYKSKIKSLEKENNSKENEFDLEL